MALIRRSFVVRTGSALRVARNPLQLTLLDAVGNVIEPALYAYSGSAQRINEALSLGARIEALVKKERAVQTKASGTTKTSAREGRPE